MYIDYTRIITEDFKSFITDSELAELKEVARKEKAILTARYNPDTLRRILERRANEIVTINAKYQAYNDYEKAIVANNIVLDNKKFASVLNSGNFDAESLDSFIKMLRYIKNRLANGDYSEKDQKYMKIADNFAKKLVAHFAKYLGINNQNLLINKINEILSYEPELINKKNDSKHK
jgi:hypothetical protein